ncbi:DUF3427 domain-containing protein [Methanobrevibacter sp.]
MVDFNNDIIDGARTAFIDENFESSNYLKPKLIINSFGNKVLNSIKEELNNCDEFYISVAFITMGGLTPLLQDFLDLEAKGIKGKIITTDYLNFTEPEALRKLNSFSNIEVKLYLQENKGFHTKGYIFRKDNVYKSIIGSSNLTLDALTVNKEWNIGFSSLNEGEMVTEIFKEFNELWENASNLEDVILQYESVYNHARQFTDFRKEYLKLKEENSADLVPNIMQEKFLSNLRELIKKDENRALLVSATGTGKTYASAFAVHEFKPKRFLFLVHREQIAKQAMKSYKRVFKGEDNKFGLLSGNSKDYNADYLFSTVQTMSKDEVYSQFNREHFDYIIIDEVHKAGAISYLKLIEYFQPKFYLGMSGSPDRSDDFNIYELFDYNIPLDIRLQDALKEDLLCPFHYFGITDIEVNGESLDDKSDFNNLVSNERVSYILEKSQYYGYSGNRIKGLVFCSTKKEAKSLAKEFSKRGHPSIALTGEDSQSAREEAIDRLTNDNRKDNIEYIITVDIFNEGVDIPEINQVLLIRPTESSIIFIQQLGRGLRKFKNKEYVVILDFIGNYNNNFLIPIALSGDRSYDKDNIRRYILEGSKIIPGSSTISFDEISRKRIYESLDNTNFSKISLFKEKYKNLKYKLGRIPYLVDFYENRDFNPLLILSHNKYDSYYNFLIDVDDEYKDILGENEIKYLKFISDNFANGKRPHELLMIKFLVLRKYFTIKDIEDALKDYKIYDDTESINHSFKMFNLEFFIKKDQDKYEGISFFKNHQTELDGENIRFEISEDFENYLNNPVFYRHLNDVVDFGLLRYENYGRCEEVNLNLYSKYKRKDVCRLLNWPHDDSSTMYGYRIKHNTCPIFVTYEKKEDISSSTKYQDEFESRDIFSWMTRSKVKLESKEAQSIINYEKTNLKIHLFIKKSDDEGSDFYYIGQMEPFKWVQTKIKNDNGENLDIVNFKYKLHNPVKEEIYKYFNDKVED